MKWTSEVFNLMPLPLELINQIFVPLNEEEKSRLPSLYEKSECKPSQELLPKHPAPHRERKLRPTKKEMLASILPQNHTVIDPPSPPISPQTKRIGSQADILSQESTRQ